jgi:hypothetical protein
MLKFCHVFGAIKRPGRASSIQGAARVDCLSRFACDGQGRGLQKTLAAKIDDKNPANWVELDELSRYSFNHARNRSSSN